MWRVAAVVCVSAPLDFTTGAWKEREIHESSPPQHAQHTHARTFLAPSTPGVFFEKSRPREFQAGFARHDFPTHLHFRERKIFPLTNPALAFFRRGAVKKMTSITCGARAREGRESVCCNISLLAGRAQEEEEERGGRPKWPSKEDEAAAAANGELTNGNIVFSVDTKERERDTHREL